MSRKRADMQWRNSADNWGLISIALHWLVAVAVIGMFALGLWMTELSYYDSWYRTAPHLHKSIGILLCLAVLLRIAWRLIDSKPAEIPEHSELEKRAARIVHALLYLLLIALFISGYLISTADGRPIDVFNWFAIPATLKDLPNQEDIAGTVHYALAISLISLVTLHALGALKHHFIDKDQTLSRMTGRTRHNRVQQ